MPVTLDTRKPIVTIEADDLEAFPIWEFCHDEEDVEGMDETWVRPVDAAEIPDCAYALTVAATFAAANGFEFKGLVSVDTAVGFSVSGFATPYPRYCFVRASAPKSDKAALAKVVAAAPELVFPVSYRVCVPVKGEQNPRTGHIG